MPEMTDHNHGDYVPWVETWMVCFVFLVAFLMIVDLKNDVVRLEHRVERLQARTGMTQPP